MWTSDNQSIVPGSEGQLRPVLLTGPLALPPAEALLVRLSRSEHIQLRMADNTDLCARGSAYTQQVWVVMRSCFKGRCKILAVSQTPDEFRSVCYSEKAFRLFYVFVRQF